MKAITMKPVLCMALTIMMLTSFQGGAQIGINTQTPDASAALDIQPSSVQPNAGLLIPRLNQAQRTAIGSPARGLLAFDMTDNLFYVNLTAATHDWFAVNPWRTKASSATTGATNYMYTHNTITRVGIGTSVPSEKLEVVGRVKAPAVKADTIMVPGFANNALIPTGAIIMWSGNTAPAGWALCDGTYQSGIYTPDLRGRFVVGYNPALPDYDLPGNKSTVGGTIASDTGGEEKHTLTAAESGMPSHSHTSPPHGHGSANGVYASGPGPTDVYAMGNAECCTNAGTPPFSSVSVSIDPAAAQNASQAHENRPPYYVLAYIIKLP